MTRLRHYMALLVSALRHEALAEASPLWQLLIACANRDEDLQSDLFWQLYSRHASGGASNSLYTRLLLSFQHATTIHTAQHSHSHSQKQNKEQNHSNHRSTASASAATELHPRMRSLAFVQALEAALARIDVDPDAAKRALAALRLGPVLAGDAVALPVLPGVGVLGVHAEEVRCPQRSANGMVYVPLLAGAMPRIAVSGHRRSSDAGLPPTNPPVVSECAVSQRVYNTSGSHNTAQGSFYTPFVIYQ